MAKYNKDLVEEICKLIITDSYTYEEICSMVKIRQSTFYKWKAEKVEFSDAIKAAQKERDEIFVVAARKSLRKLVEGYSVDEIKVVTVDSGKTDANGNPIPKIKEQTKTNKHYKPDTAAVIFTLANLDSDNFKNKQQSELVGKDGERLFDTKPIDKEGIIEKMKEIKEGI